MSFEEQQGHSGISDDLVVPESALSCLGDEKFEWNCERQRREVNGNTLFVYVT